MDTLNTVLSVPAIVAIVQLLKEFGVVGRYALVAAVTVAVGLNVAAYYLASSGLFDVVMAGLLLGLSAAGLYDVAKTASTHNDME